MPKDPNELVQKFWRLVFSVPYTLGGEEKEKKEHPPRFKVAWRVLQTLGGNDLVLELLL